MNWQRKCFLRNWMDWNEKSTFEWSWIENWLWVLFNEIISIILSLWFINKTTSYFYGSFRMNWICYIVKEQKRMISLEDFIRNRFSISIILFSFFKFSSLTTSSSPASPKIKLMRIPIVIWLGLPFDRNKWI